MLINRSSETWHGRDQVLAEARDSERARYALAAAPEMSKSRSSSAVEPAGVVLERVVRKPEGVLARRFV